MPRGFYAIISRRWATCKPGSGNGNPVGARARPQGRGAATAAPEPTCPHRATQPARGGRGKGGRQRGSARARDEVRDRARPDDLRGANTAALGDSRAGQRARGAHNNAQARRHFYAATPEPVRRPPMMCPRRRAARGRRPEHGHETPGRHPRQNGGRCLNGWLCSGASSGYLLLDIRHRIPSF